MRTHQVTQQNIIADPEMTVIVMIMAVNVFVSTYLNIRLFTGLLDFNDSDLLLLTLFRFSGKRETPGIVFITELSHLDKIDFPVVVKIKIIDTTALIDFLFKFFCRLNLFGQLEHRLQIKPVGSLFGHDGHILLVNRLRTGTLRSTCTEHPQTSKNDQYNSYNLSHASSLSDKKGWNNNEYFFHNCTGIQNSENRSQNYVCTSLP